MSANNLLSVDTIPVKNIPLVVDGHDSEVLMDKVDGGEDDNTDNPVLIQRMVLHCQEICLLASQVIHLRRELADSRVEHERQLKVRFVYGNYFQ